MANTKNKTTKKLADQFEGRRSSHSATKKAIREVNTKKPKEKGVKKVLGKNIKCFRLWSEIGNCIILIAVIHHEKNIS